MFSSGDRSGVQAGQCSTQTFFTMKQLCGNRCRVQFSIALLKYAVLPEKDVHLDGMFLADQ